MFEIVTINFTLIYSLACVNMSKIYAATITITLTITDFRGE